jgi:hypothetical protein
VRNEKNGYPVPDFNKTMKNVTKDPVTHTEKPSKKSEDITEKFMEKILDMVNQNVQDVLKKFQDKK